MSRSITDTPRWHADVHYRTDTGATVVEHDVEELGDLELLIELGPMWDTIIKIEITHQRPTIDQPGITVEEAERL